MGAKAGHAGTWSAQAEASGLLSRLLAAFVGAITLGILTALAITVTTGLLWTIPVGVGLPALALGVAVGVVLATAGCLLLAALSTLLLRAHVRSPKPTKVSAADYRSARNESLVSRASVVRAC